MNDSFFNLSFRKGESMPQSKATVMAELQESLRKAECLNKIFEQFIKSNETRSSEFFAYCNEPCDKEIAEE